MTPKTKNWIDKNIKIDLTNKNIFITGSNSGIGFELAKECAYLKANLFLLVRNIEKGKKAKEEILKEFPNTKIVLIQLDLADFDSIKSSVKEVRKYDVDVFINNAGTYHLPYQKTKQDLEITMGTNFIGSMYLSELLIPYFLSLNHTVKIIYTTSMTSRLFKINYNNFFLEKNYNKLKIYALSKQAINNLYFYYIDKYKDSNLIFYLAHPGCTYTPLFAKGYKSKLFVKAANAFSKTVFHSSEQAALTFLYDINKDVPTISGPKGFLEFSGLPKSTSFKKKKDYLKTIETGKSIIEKCINQ